MGALPMTPAVPDPAEPGDPGPAASPPAPTIGTADPLSAAYCAERAAAAIHHAEQANFGPDVSWLDCAKAWRELGESMNANVGMVRPRNPDSDRR